MMTCWEILLIILPSVALPMMFLSYLQWRHRRQEDHIPQQIHAASHRLANEVQNLQAIAQKSRRDALSSLAQAIENRDRGKAS